MRQAFSLVELSIVLVILGLLTGGILAGQSLIRAAELRSVVSEYQRYLAASHAFRDKYFAIPGDMNSATRFWTRMTTVAATACTTNSSAAVGTPGTCDGNGDGIVDMAGAASQSGEGYQFWKQLANAGLVEGTYTGTADTGGARHSTTSNVPVSKLSNSGWTVENYGNYAGNAQTYALLYDNTFVFGAFSTTGPTSPASLKPEEAWNIDVKLDDGKPAYGKIVPRYWDNACATGGATFSDRANSVYNLSNSTIQCALYFIRLF